MNSICADVMRRRLEVLKDYRPRWGVQGAITRDQVDTAFGALEEGVKRVFSETSADEFGKICG